MTKKKLPLDIDKDVLESLEVIKEENQIAFEELITKEKMEGSKMLNVKVGIDFGASRIKVSYKDAGDIKEFQFPNRFNFDTALKTSGYLVDCEDGSIIVGCLNGVSNLKKRKVNYDYITEILHVVVYELKRAFDVEDISLSIITVLPPQQYKETRAQFKEIIQSANGTVRTVEGVKTTVNIDKVGVGCEGVVLLKTFNLDNTTDNAENVLVIDAGSSTTDIVVLEKQGTVWKVKDALTMEQGGNHICKAIAQHINSTETGLSYDGDDLERKMKYQLDGEMHQITEHIECADDYIKTLFAHLSKIDNIRQYKVILAGGTSRLVKENSLFNKTIKGYSCIKDDLLDYGNSRGALLS